MEIVSSFRNLTVFSTYNAVQEYLQIREFTLLNNGDIFLEMCYLAILLFYEHDRMLLCKSRWSYVVHP